MTTVSVRPDPAVQFDAGDQSDELLLLDVALEPGRRVISLTGDLDLCTRHLLFLAATAPSPSPVVIDLRDLAFMDCAGYGGIVASANVVHDRGQTVTVRGQLGQPARLLDLIRTLEADRTPAGGSA